MMHIAGFRDGNCFGSMRINQSAEWSVECMSVFLGVSADLN